VAATPCVGGPCGLQPVVAVTWITWMEMRSNPAFAPPSSWIFAVISRHVITIGKVGLRQSATHHPGQIAACWPGALRGVVYGEVRIIMAGNVASAVPEHQDDVLGRRLPQWHDVINQAARQFAVR
jgi:hypothetical protein